MRIAVSCRLEYDEPVRYAIPVPVLGFGRGPATAACGRKRGDAGGEAVGDTGVAGIPDLSGVGGSDDPDPKALTMLRGTGLCAGAFGDFGTDGADLEVESVRER